MSGVPNIRLRRAVDDHGSVIVATATAARSLAALHGNVIVSTRECGWRRKSLAEVSQAAVVGVGHLDLVGHLDCSENSEVSRGIRRRKHQLIADSDTRARALPRSTTLPPALRSVSRNCRRPIGQTLARRIRFEELDVQRIDALAVLLLIA